MFAAELHDGGSWAWSALSDATSHGPAITLTSATSGVGLIRSTSNGELRFTTWTPGAWTPFSAVAPLVTTSATPSMAATSGTAVAVFLGDNSRHYFAARDAAWSPTAEPVGGATTQAFGPSPASITTLGADSVIAYAGNDHDLYDQTRSGGTWQAGHGHGLGNAVNLTPAIIALTSGPALMIAFVGASDTHIMFTTGSGATWSAPAAVNANAFTNDPVSLAPLPGGGAVLAYRGTDQKIYWSRYSPTGSPAWSQPAALATPTNYSTPSTPAVAPGIGGVDAEMVFIDAATGAANHARLTGTSWSAPVVIGGSGLGHAAAASFGG